MKAQKQLQIFKKRYSLNKAVADMPCKNEVNVYIFRFLR